MFVLLCASAGLNLYALIGRAASDHAGTDFNQLYATASMLRAGLHSGNAAELYDINAQRRVQESLFHCGYLPGNHPAYEYLLLAPLSWLPPGTAYFCFFAVNVLLLGFALWVVCASPGRWWAMAVLAFAFVPVIMAFYQGQDSILLTALVAAALLALDRNCSVTAGMLVALGLFKFQLTIPIFLLLLLWRHWRFCFGFVLSGVSLAVLSVILTGTGGQRLYWQMLTQGEGSFDALRMVNLRALGAAAFPGASATVLAGATLAIGALLALILSRQHRSDREALLVAIPVATLCSYHLYSHDLTLLVLPMAVLLQTELSALEMAAAVLPLAATTISRLGYVVALPVALFLWVFSIRHHDSPLREKKKLSVRDLNAAA